MLRDRYRVILQTQWDGRPADALVALHARRSAPSVRRFAEAGGPVAVVLTGTDLYRDLPDSREAREALDRARCIVALQDDAPRLLEARWRTKAQVIFQSAIRLAPAIRAQGRLDCLALGHLRGEKDPATLFEAIGLLAPALPVRVRHVGATLDAALGEAAAALQARDPRYRHIGPLPHGLARAALKRSHLLIHPSRMEGGANAIAEAITSGTPVIASRVSGNVGMLGQDYAGYFECGDAAGLARCITRCAHEPGFLRHLAMQCDRRLPLFAPAAEERAVRRLVAGLLAIAPALESV